MRSWVIEAEKNESEASKGYKQLKKRLSKLVPSWVKSLPAGLVAGVFVFVAYYYVVGSLEEVFKLLSQISLPFVTDMVIRTIATLLPFGFFILDFSKLHPGMLFVMFLFMVSITCLWSVDFLIFFIITLNINLKLAYGRSFAWLRWSFRVFVAVFCTKAISHFFGITSWFPILFLTIVTGVLYTFVDSRIHHSTNNAVMIRDEFQQRYFQRGIAKTQMNFVKQRLKVFLFIVVVTILSTLGHVYPWPTFDYGSETTANVFCKIDHTTQLECHVKTAYNEPYFESQDCKSGSQEWDYCGALVVTSE